MAATNRAKLIGKLHTALKKHYSPVQPGPRPLLEQVLYASLLQDAAYDQADEGMAKCEQDFFDWNEVRVTTVTELSQVLSNLPEPEKAAQRLKGNLQDIFEEFYSFEIDHLKKENQGKAVAKFEKMSAMSPFVLAYTVQNGLGGHSIPVDYAAMVIMLATEIVSQTEAASGKVPGLERAIPKTKGVEFGSLLHQCAIDLLKDPNDKTGRAVLDAVAKGSSKRLDEWLENKSAAKKRVRKRKKAEAAAAAAQAESADEETPVKSTGKATAKKTAVKKSGATKQPAKPKTAEKADASAAKTPTRPKTAVSPKTSAAKKTGVKTTGTTAAKTGTAKKAGDDKASKAKSGKTASSKTATKKTNASKAAAKKSPTKKKPAAKKAPAKKSAAAKTATKKASAAASGGIKSSGSKKATTKKATPKKAAKKSDNRKLTKKKPR
ncbi:MAG: hypothetical protein AAF958_13880 [Planctomycetota bacterium]